MIKLVASDMDGTLLNSHMRISETNKKSILHLQQAGVEFIVATGRDYNQIKPLLLEQGISCSVIALNGATFYNEAGTQLFSHALDISEVKQMIHFLSEHNVFVELMTSKGIFSNTKERRLATFAYYIQELKPGTSYSEAFSISEREARNLQIRFIDSYDALLQDSQTEVYKISAYTDQHPAFLHPLKETLLQSHLNLSITSFHESNLEINHVYAQKGKALSEYAEKRGLSAQQVMAIGDNNNDISMLQWATHSVAMMNASPAIKEMASHVTTSNDQNGVAEAIDRLILNATKTL